MSLSPRPPDGWLRVLRQVVGGLLILLLTQAACRPVTMTNEDQHSLDNVRATFSPEFTFVPDDSGLLRMQQERPDVSDVERKVRAAFDMFFVRDGIRRRSSEFSFLGFYGFDGRFRFGLMFDPETGAVVTKNSLGDR